MTAADVTWQVKALEEFSVWFDGLGKIQRKAVLYSLNLLKGRGPRLGFPYSSGIRGSRHKHMRELRVQSGGKPLRIFYAYDPLRTAILLIGGDKSGVKNFYEKYVPLADKLYDRHLTESAKDQGGKRGR